MHFSTSYVLRGSPTSIKGYILVIEEMTPLRHCYIEMNLHKEFSRRPFLKHLRPVRGFKRAPRNDVRWEILSLFYLINCVFIKKKYLCIGQFGTYSLFVCAKFHV